VQDDKGATNFLKLITINVIEQVPRDPIKLVEWQSRDDKAKAIIGLALVDSELHHIDLEIIQGNLGYVECIVWSASGECKVFL
jgi:hypothetical protein